MDIAMQNSRFVSKKDSELAPQETQTPAIIMQPKLEVTKTNYDRWVGFRGLKVDAILFSKGLLYAQSSSSACFSTSPEGIDDHSFSLNGRRLAFTKKGQSASEKQSRTLARQINFMCSREVDDDSDNEEIIVNLERRQEVFYPLRAGGVYVYPWLSKIQGAVLKPELGRLRQFFTVGCMFGTTLKGRDKLGNAFRVVKHNIEFFPGQRIEAIIFSSDDSNPYEEVLFEELKILVNLITRLSTSEEAKNLYYHVPYYDYMLFGIELFMRGRMTFEALDQFFIAIFNKQIEYKEKINTVCGGARVRVIIESPFENLFGPISVIREPTINILERLGVEYLKVISEADQQQSKTREAALVQSCLQKLQNNIFNESHKKVWQDFIKVTPTINDLEGLFKVANAVMIGLSCQGKQDYETCSLLPVSEKQIAISYEGYCKLIQDARYPGVVNLTLMEPVISHDYSSNGLLFYFDSCATSLSLALEKGLLRAAHANASRDASKPGLDLLQILNAK